MSGKIRVVKQKNFTIIPNEFLRRKDLSWKAKGLLTFLLSMSDEWEVHKSDLANRSTDGYDSMISGWKELEDARYIETKESRVRGLFKGYDYIVHESPIRDFTESVFPISDNPQLRITSKQEVLPLIDTNVSIGLFSFEDFWKLYPVKRAKIQCNRKWDKLKKVDKVKISKTLQEFVDTKPFANYTHPYPMTYLNSEVWNDVEEVIEQPTQELKLELGDLYAQLRG